MYLRLASMFAKLKILNELHMNARCKGIWLNIGCFTTFLTPIYLSTYISICRIIDRYSLDISVKEMNIATTIFILLARFRNMRLWGLQFFCRSYNLYNGRYFWQIMFLRQKFCNMLLLILKLKLHTYCKMLKCTHLDCASSFLDMGLVLPCKFIWM